MGTQRARDLDDFRGTDRFDIVRALGRGGMGAVYEALDRQRGSRVALKTLLHLDADALTRFKREFRSLADVQHPHLVGLRELVKDGHTWFFTMDLVRGWDIYQHFHVPGLPPGAATLTSAAASPAAAREHAGAEQTMPTALTPPPGSADASRASPRHTNALSPAQLVEVRRLAAEVTTGLMALHRAHKIHRDVKPSNILVSSDDGRAVLVDFGIIADLREHVVEHRPIGTVSYMAPEYADQGALMPASDFYGLGVTLYRVLTGGLPFGGTQKEILEAKLHHAPLDIRRWSNAVPDDLAELCMALLSREPAARPGGEEILERLGRRDTDSVTLASDDLFVGRDDELESLEAAFADARSGNTVTVLIEGASGIGKSALVNRFLRDLRLSTPRPAILAGRCYERESVPYKAVDSVIDALDRHLASRSSAVCSALMPPDAPLLGHLFPVLRKGAAWEAPAGAIQTIDIHEIRARAFATLREMLRRLGARGPLVVAIDELQWADADSLSLLADVLRRPDGPALLCIATVRTGRDLGAGVMSPEDLAARLSNEPRRISLAPLGRDDARSLACALAERAGLEVEAEDVAREAQGHPLFIETIFRHRIDGDGAGAPHLDDALWTHIVELDGDARRALELIAIAGTPIAQETLARAAGLTLSAFDDSVSLLRAARLVKTGGTRRSAGVEPYHDRIRETVLARLDETSARKHHRRIARALEGSYGRDEPRLAVHWHEAGEPRRALKHARRAAEGAARALAFDRAAELYRYSVALQHEIGEGVEHDLCIELAGALARAGRGREAAACYLETADDVPPRQALELRLAAASQFLRSGHFDEGTRVVREFAPTVGISYPKTPGRALLRVIGSRIRIKVRGLGYTERSEDELDPERLLQIDALGAVGSVLAMVDPIRGRCLNERQMRLALGAGEPRRIALALAAHVTHAAAVGGAKSDRETEAILRVLEPLYQRIDDPLVRGRIDFGRGSYAYLRGRWREARRLLERAHELFSASPGASFEAQASETWLFNVDSYLGDLRALAETLPARTRAAEDRGDLYGATQFRASYANIVWLARDEPDYLLGELDRAMRQWSPNGFHLQHWYELHGRVQALLYQRRLEEVAAVTDERGRQLQRSMLMRLESIRASWAVLRARVALLAAAKAPDQRNAKLTEVTRALADLGKESLTWAPAWRALLEAGAAQVAGDTDRARRGYETARDAFAEVEIPFGVAAAEWRLAELDGRTARPGDGDGLAWLEAEGVVAPARFVDMLVPAID